jgi:hypothetical protein
LLLAVLTEQTRVLGPDHPDTLQTRRILAHALHSAGDVLEGVTLLRHLLADQARLLGPNHQDTLQTRQLISSLTTDPVIDATAHSPGSRQPRPDVPPATAEPQGPTAKNWADQALHDEAATLGQLGKELGDQLGRVAKRRLAIVMASAAVVAVGILVATYLHSGIPGSYPGSGSGGRVRELALPIDSAVRYSPISWDFGEGAQAEGNVDTALYQPAQGAQTPGLYFLGAYSLNISAVNADENTCLSAIFEHPGSGPIMSLHKGLLFCVQAVEGIALLEVTQNLDSSKTLHLRETYWPAPAPK